MRALAEGTDFMYDTALMAANTGSAKAPTDTKDASGLQRQRQSVLKKMHAFGK